jgi:hypothetical protein
MHLPNPVQWLLRLWRDEAGFLNSSELIVLAAILILGIIPGIAVLRRAIMQEFAQQAQSMSGRPVEIQSIEAQPERIHVASDLMQ